MKYYIGMQWPGIPRTWYILDITSESYGCPAIPVDGGRAQE
jgi:hypothetical protein